MKFTEGLGDVLNNLGRRTQRRTQVYVTPGGEIWDTELQRWIPKKDWNRRQAGLKPFKVGKTKSELIDEEDDEEDDDPEWEEVKRKEVYYLGGKSGRKKVPISYLSFQDWITRWWPEGIEKDCTRFRVQDCVFRSLKKKKMCKPCKQFAKLEQMWNEAQVGK